MVLISNVVDDIQLKRMYRTFSVCGVKFDSCGFDTWYTFSHARGKRLSFSHVSWTEGAVLQGIYYKVLAVAAVQETREEEALRFQAGRFPCSR